MGEREHRKSSARYVISLSASFFSLGLSFPLLICLPFTPSFHYPCTHTYTHNAYRPPLLTTTCKTSPLFHFSCVPPSLFLGVRISLSLSTFPLCPLPSFLSPSLRCLMCACKRRCFDVGLVQHVHPELLEALWGPLGPGVCWLSSVVLQPRHTFRIQTRSSNVKGGCDERGGFITISSSLHSSLLPLGPLSLTSLLLLLCSPPFLCLNAYIK